MLQEKKIYVYFDNNVDKRIKVGCLFADFQRGKEKFSFEYDDEFFTSFLFRNFFDYDLQPYIFFLSGESFKRLIKKYPVKSINDISFIIALCRPPFIESSEVHDESPTELNEYLTETKGLLLYQEQVMEILHDLGGINYAEADRVRKLLARRKYDDASEYEKTFTEKASAKFGYEIANKIWDYLCNNCKYCFLKAHSVSYAFMAYQSAYLKANYRKEFGEIFTERRKEFARSVTM